jgi:hypothetical protein
VIQHPVLAGGLSLLTSALTAGIVLLILPAPHVRLHYLIAGTAGTAVCLGLLLAIIVARWPMRNTGTREPQ